MSFFRAIFKRFDQSEARRLAYLDLMILAGLNDEQLSNADLDQISYLILENELLETSTWIDVESRVSRIQSEPRPVKNRLTEMANLFRKDEHKTMALKLVTRMLFTSERERSIDFLDLVADEFKVEKASRADLLTPWASVDSGTKSFRRCAYNNPSAIRNESIFEAMAHAENEVELALLTYKLAATRNALVHLGPETVISALGETVELPSGVLRVDAFLSGANHHWISRFLARGEAMHSEEFALLRELLNDLEENTKIFIGHAGKYSIRDFEKLRALDENRIQVTFISV